MKAVTFYFLESRAQSMSLQTCIKAKHISKLSKF